MGTPMSICQDERGSTHDAAVVRVTVAPPPPSRARVPSSGGANGQQTKGDHRPKPKTSKASVGSQADESSNLRILLLGGADAGKSTIVKQMRILHMNGFSVQELSDFQKYIRYNLFQIFHEVANAILYMFSKDIRSEDMELLRQFAGPISWIVEIDIDAEIYFLRRFGGMEVVKKFMEEHWNHPTLPDNANYYFPRLERVTEPDGEPTDDDILNLRIPTTTIQEINFSFSTCTIRLIDVGGQRTYRKKWIHCFEGVTAVLFLASMASYDQILENVDPSSRPVLYAQIFQQPDQPKLTNRLRDSANLFGEIIRNNFLRSSAIILFLNKTDLFEKKLKSSKLGSHFKAYIGDNDYPSTSAFIREYFFKRKSKRDTERKVYYHYTCATDTKNVEFVFKATCDIILQKNLYSSGIS